MSRATAVMTPRDLSVQGHVSPGFEAVRHAFAENFTDRHELGGACCAYVRGEKVVDLWGGFRNQDTEAPWEQNTMVIVYSATKGPAAMTLAPPTSQGFALPTAHAKARGQRPPAHTRPRSRPHRGASRNGSAET